MTITIATLVGCAIGDALGQSFEMCSTDNPKLQNWDGLFRDGATFWRRDNHFQYSDDTLMSMALAASLLEHQGFNPEDVAQKYLAWMESGNTRGIGGTTAAALTRIKLGAHYTESGLILNADGTPVGGNGTAMRASPIGLVYRNNLSKLLEVAMEDASITHNSLEPKLGSIAVALATALLANRTASPQDVVYQISDLLPDSVLKSKLELVQKWLEQGTELGSIAAEALAEIGTAGYVPETVGAAFFCLGASNNFRDCVVMAVRAGGDTDTTAAVAGALAGTWYGVEGISEEYQSVENRELLQGLTD